MTRTHWPLSYAPRILYILFFKEVKIMDITSSLISVPKEHRKYYRAFHTKNGHYDQYNKILLCIRHPLIRNILLQWQNNKCPICGKAITSATASVHHQSYDYICTYNPPYIHAMTHYTPIRQDPGYTLLPDCDQCFLNAPDKFAKCLSHLIMLDSICHSKIHGITKPPQVA